jgi:transposase
MGLEKKLDMWKKPDPVFYHIKKLTRERTSLLDERTRINNELHAETSGAWPNKKTIKRYHQRTSVINKQIDEIEKEIHEIVKSYPWLAEKVKKICSVKGLGWLTVITIISETDGFNLVTNRSQLVSYAGYDVINKESGTSVKGKPKISKKGNKHIRRALHFPALTAVKHDQRMGIFYQRLENRQKIKMKAYTAVQRKLLMLIYTLWKKDQVYDPNFNTKEMDIKYSGQPTGAALTELAFSGS